MYGTQTIFIRGVDYTLFENDVEMYGTQTVAALGLHMDLFENDVEMYGTQTDGLRSRKKGLV